MQDYISAPFVMKEEKKEIFFGQFINLESVDMDIIEYYMKNELVVGLYVDDIEKVDAQGKLPPPLIENIRNQKKFTIHRKPTTRKESDGSSKWVNCTIM